ncbi:hypothetical protein D9M72_448600 [compost metagenome]
MDYSEEEGWLRFRRGDVLVALNFSEQTVKLEDAAGSVLLSTDEASVPDGGSLLLAPWSAVIVRA